MDHTVAGAPFNEGEGDVVLRTSDKVHFYVYRVVLGLASPFFKTMFSLRQPDNAQVGMDGLPVIEVSEDAPTFECLLRYCYPIRPPIVTSLDFLSPVLEAAIKYDMEEQTRILKERLRDLTSQKPLHAYVISCRLNCEEEASLAASIWKSTREEWVDNAENFLETVSGASFVSEMGNISSGMYYRLLEFVRGKEVSKFCTAETNAVPEDAPSRDGNVGANEREDGEEDVVMVSQDGDENASSTSAIPVDPTVVNKYPFNLADADFVIQSCDGMKFRVHKILLKLHTDPKHAGKTLLGDSGGGLQIDGLPGAIIPEVGSILDELLTLCYPSAELGCSNIIADWLTSRFRDGLKVMHAARRLGVASLVETYKSQMEFHTPREPLAMYCVAISLEWASEARCAAEIIAKTFDEVIGFTPLMDYMPATEYHKLLSFCHRYRQKQFQVLSKKQYCQWAEVTQWKSHWFESPSGYSSRWIHAVLVEREVVAADAGRLQYREGGKFNLKELAGLNAKLQDDMKQALAKITL